MNCPSSIGNRQIVIRKIHSHEFVTFNFFDDGVGSSYGSLCYRNKKIKFVILSKTFHYSCIFERDRINVSICRRIGNLKNTYIGDHRMPMAYTLELQCLNHWGPMYDWDIHSSKFRCMNLTSDVWRIHSYMRVIIHWTASPISEQMLDCSNFWRALPMNWYDYTLPLWESMSQSNCERALPVFPWNTSANSILKLPKPHFNLIPYLYPCCLSIFHLVQPCWTKTQNFSLQERGMIAMLI